ncbi:hypothetical protein [Methylobacterium trifolii]|uniref:Uncharacterized protein n=1 Tax=Methylobacterium trifolii TaxID=1003092 RepID=A0ABQ4TS06_9HYPH|nr:hypothetical protein [Methylobacterium trifolii]GJE57970.1 hypothetical protein MPOCJGCO_0046 [Methylobacterium trifolii]
MRPARPFASVAVLILALASAGGARAQARPGWVDPPARQAAPSTPAAPSAAVPDTKPAPDRGATAEKPPTEAAPPRSVAERSALRRAERPRPRSRVVRRGSPRLADTPAAAVPAPAADPRFSGWAGEAQALTADYLDAFSGGGMIAGTPRFYGSQVRFHGRAMTLGALLAEKRQFALRWPDRRYEPRSTRTACNAALATCVVHTVVAFRAASPTRGALSQGVAELVLEVSFAGPRPTIVAESSRVLRRGGNA